MQRVFPESFGGSKVSGANLSDPSVERRACGEWLTAVG
jgi:hypothetical protein